MTPDVNVLIAAASPDHPFHQPARNWLLHCGETPGEHLALLPMVVSGFLRISTNPRIFARPATAADAFRFIQQMIDLPAVTVLPLGQEWPLFEELCLRHNLAGNDIPDAWIAAAVLHHAEHLGTFDRGFRRFLGRRHVTMLG